MHDIQLFDGRLMLPSGEEFNLPEFNEQISKYGRIPLDVLEEAVDQWILDKKEIQGILNRQTHRHF